MVGTDLLRRRTVGPEPIGHDHFGTTVLAHCFSWKFQRCLLVAPLRAEALQYFDFVIDGPPKVVAFSVHLHKHLVQVPPPAARLHALNAPFSDLGGEHFTEPVPPKSNGLLAHVDAALVEQIFHVSQ